MRRLLFEIMKIRKMEVENVVGGKNPDKRAGVILYLQV
jgi:hypothetical protein